MACESSQNHPSTLTAPILQVYLYPSIIGLDSPSFQIGHTIPQCYPFAYAINTYATLFRQVGRGPFVGLYNAESECPKTLGHLRDHEANNQEECPWQFEETYIIQFNGRQ